MADTARATLPGCLALFAETIGHGNAAAIGRRWPGCKIRVPVTVQSPMGAQLVETVGREAAEILCREYGSERFDVPISVAAPSKKARIARANGSTTQVALRTGCTERYVRHVRNDARDDRQTGLFDDEA